MFNNNIMIPLSSSEPKAGEIVFTPTPTIPAIPKRDLDLRTILIYILKQAKGRQNRIRRYEIAPSKSKPIPKQPEILNIKPMIDHYNMILILYENLYNFLCEINIYLRDMVNKVKIDGKEYMVDENMNNDDIPERIIMKKKRLDVYDVNVFEAKNIRDEILRDTDTVLASMEELFTTGKRLNTNIDESMSRNIQEYIRDSGILDSLGMTGGSLADTNKKVDDIRKKLDSLMNGYIPTFPNVTTHKFNSADEFIEMINKLRLDIEKMLDKSGYVYEYRQTKDVVPKIDFTGAELDRIKPISKVKYDNITKMNWNVEKLATIIDKKIKEFNSQLLDIENLINDLVSKQTTIAHYKTVSYAKDDFNISMDAVLKERDELRKKLSEEQSNKKALKSHNIDLQDLINGLKDFREHQIREQPATAIKECKIIANKYKLKIDSPSFEEKLKGKMYEEVAEWYQKLEQFLNEIKEKLTNACKAISEPNKGKVISKLEKDKITEILKSINYINSITEPSILREINLDSNGFKTLLNVSDGIFRSQSLIFSINKYRQAYKEYDKKLNLPCLDRLQEYKAYIENINKDIASLGLSDQITIKIGTSSDQIPEFIKKIESIIAKNDTDIELIDRNIEDLKEKLLQYANLNQPLDLKVKEGEVLLAIKRLSKQFNKINNIMKEFMMVSVTGIPPISDQPNDLADLNRFSSWLQKGGSFEMLRTNIQTMMNSEEVIKNIMKLVTLVDKFKQSVNILDDEYRRYVIDLRGCIVLEYYRLVVINYFTKDPRADDLYQKYQYIMPYDIPIFIGILGKFPNHAVFKYMGTVYERLVYLVDTMKTMNKAIFIDKNKKSFLDLLMLIHFMDTFK